MTIKLKTNRKGARLAGVEIRPFPELIPITAAAARLGMTRDGLHKARRAGNLKAVQLGRFWYVTPLALDIYRIWHEARDGKRQGKL